MRYGSIVMRSKHNQLGVIQETYKTGKIPEMPLFLFFLKSFYFLVISS